ncbi:hypothetical protein JM18_002007 [Phytophthora kernoviae]|uniref:Uncharacterized protein n=1 Tax=Phytophthora kernoviae TaxID=325452 RepID=A0A921VBK0_9STRA|nr:hypothetical protein JM18_002007 [Phytophthora kernoviae]
MTEDAKLNRYSVLVDLTAGTVGGCSGVVVGQPFDTVKVRLQTHSAFYNGAFDCVRKTWKHEGSLGFFKGMVSPLVGSAWSNAAMFAVYERTLQVIDDTPQNPTLKSVFYAGAVGGFFQTIPLAPTELVKCRLQVQDATVSRQYRGPMDCIRHIYKCRGTPGLFLGFTCTLWREVPSFAVYFWLYEYTKRKMIDYGINSHTSMLTAGGIAGVGSWVVSYPLDVIKSAIQTLPMNYKPGEHKMAYQTRQLYRLGALAFANDDPSSGVLHMKLNRPKVVNAMNMQMWVDLAQAFELVELDPSVKAVVVSGEGRGFTSGMDLDVFASMQKVAMEESCDGRKREKLMKVIDKFQQIISAPEKCRVPVIAAVHGPCIGAGVDFITACDLCYSDVSAIFSVKEVDLAIIADVGTLQRLPKLVGERQAKELAFTGRNFGGLEAEKLGLVLRALPDQEALMNHVGDVAKDIAKKSPLTIRGIKQTIHYQRDHSTTDSLQQIRYHNAAVLYSDDLVQAVGAIMSKTEPKFRRD